MSSRDLKRARASASLRTRLWVMLLTVGAVSVLAAATAMQPDAGATKPVAARQTAQPQPFSATTVIEMARRLSSNSYSPKRIDSNSPLTQLNYDQYRHIRFNREQSIWRNEQVPFHVEVLPAGFLFQTPVQVWLVENGQPQEIQSTPDMFVIGEKIQKQLANVQ